MIDPTCYDDRTDEEFAYKGGNSEFVLWALLVAFSVVIFGFGFFCGSVFA